MEPYAFWDSLLHQLGVAFFYSFGHKRMGKSRGRTAVRCEVKMCPLQSGEGVPEIVTVLGIRDRGERRQEVSILHFQSSSLTPVLLEQTCFGQPTGWLLVVTG